VNGDLELRHTSGKKVTFEGLQGSCTEYGWTLVSRKRTFGVHGHLIMTANERSRCA